jgi:hypothetical protein
MPKSPKVKKRPKPKKAAGRPDASQTALSIVETIIGGKLIEKTNAKKRT